jgi:hypothetical protein
MILIGMSAAAILQCVSGAGSGSLKQPLVLNIKPETADLRSLRERNPPRARVTFAGEGKRANEWQFAQDSDQIVDGTQLARVSLSPSDGRFVMHFGAAYRKSRKVYRFEELMSGTCTLLEKGVEEPEVKS